MNFNAVRQAIYNELVTNYSESEPLFFDNQPRNQPINAGFNVVSLIMQSSEQASLGDLGETLYRTNGILQVDIMHLEDTGTKRAFELSEIFFDILLRKKITLSGGDGVIQFRTPDVRTLGLSDNYYRIVVSADFYVDFIK